MSFDANKISTYNYDARFVLPRTDKEELFKVFKTIHLCPAFKVLPYYVSLPQTSTLPRGQLRVKNATVQTLSARALRRQCVVWNGESYC